MGSPPKLTTHAISPQPLGTPQHPHRHLLGMRGISVCRKTSSAQLASPGDRLPWARRTPRATASGNGPSAGIGATAMRRNSRRTAGSVSRPSASTASPMHRKAGHLWVVRGQEERWFDQRQRSNLRGLARGCGDGTQGAISVRDDVRAVVKQPRKVLGVEVEVLAPPPPRDGSRRRPKDRRRRQMPASRTACGDGSRRTRISPTAPISFS